MTISGIEKNVCEDSISGIQIVRGTIRLNYA